jgi:hypothetical protein
MPSLGWFNNDEQLNALQDCYVDKITKLKRYSTRKLICFKGPSCISFLLIDKKSNNSEPSKLALSKTETQNKTNDKSAEHIFMTSIHTSKSGYENFPSTQEYFLTSDWM